MKPFIKPVLFMCAVMCCLAASAQEKGFHTGFRLGVGQAAFRINDNDTLSGERGKLMVGGGFHANYQFVRFFGVEAEALIVAKGSKITGTRDGGIFGPDERYDEIYRFTYVEIPLMAKLSLPLGNVYLKVYTGPSFNFNVSATYSVDYENSNDDDVTDRRLSGINTMETSWATGIGVDINPPGFGIYSLDLRSNVGLTSFGNLYSSGVQGYNNYFGVFLGYSF